MERLLVRGACPHDCPDTCGIVTEVQDGTAVSVYGDPDNPITRGWLCAKVRPYLDHVYHPDRLMYPLRRVGPKGGGQWQRIGWQEAIAEIADRWKNIIAEFGAEAILPYSYSGTLGLVQMIVSTARLWNRLGASRLERTICCAAAEMAVKATIGKRWAPPYSEILDSKLVLIWGHNPVSTAPHFMPFLRQAQHAGCHVVVIDPRRTQTAKGADWHLAPRPGSDGVLALALGHVLVAEGMHNETWLKEHTVGWPLLRERLAEYPPRRAAAITGVPEEDIIRLARLYGSRRPVLIKMADGINRNRNGGQNVRAICALPALTGQYGVRGGGLSYSTSDYGKWNGEAINHWRDCPPKGRSINMNRLGMALLGEAQNPPIRSLYVFGSNPVASSPNAGRIVEGMRRADLFTVVHELFLTDTADYADIVLPATSQLEHTDLHKGYGTTLLTYNRPAIAPRGECKSNWEVMGLLAEALGFQEPWLHQSADEVIEEVLEKSPALRGITLQRLKAEGAMPIPQEDATPFADARFPTPSGKVELFSQALADKGIDPLPGHFLSDEDDGGMSERGALAPRARLGGLTPPAQTENALAEALLLLTPASHHFVSSSLASQPGLLKNAGTPFLEIHPDDAAPRGIGNGEIVLVYNGRGSCRLRAVVTEATRPGVVVSPKGRWAKLDGGTNVNWTTSDALADMAGQSTFHSNRVWVRPVRSMIAD
jgi:anaerobic selenocysteine-containing dehydrogenase